MKSKKNNFYYIGYSGSVAERLKIHNSGKVIATKNNRPWELFFFEEFRNEIDAVHREKQLKSWKSRKAIEKLKLLNKNRGSSIL